MQTPDNRAGKGRRLGFTLIELVVAIAIISVLAGTLLQRVWFYQEQAEKAAMEQVAAALQSALVLQYAHLMMRGREAEIKTLLTENPIHWLQREPANYAGELRAQSPAAIPPGNWAFELNTRALVYVPYRSEYFSAAKEGHKWVRYRVRLQYEGVTDAGAARQSAQELRAVLFEPLSPYKWF